MRARLAVLSEHATLDRAVRCMTSDIACFSRGALTPWVLREYQLRPARAMIESIERGLGRSFVATFSRQAGKDEMLVHLVAYLLVRNQRRGGSIVVAESRCSDVPVFCAHPPVVASARTTTRTAPRADMPEE